MSLEDHSVGRIDPLVPLGTTAPLAEAARRLLDRSADALGEVDLASVVVVTPGRRAGRQLLVSLDEAARAAGVRFVPPTVTTLPELDARLGVSRPAVADSTTTLAAIEAALRVAIAAAFASGPEAVTDPHRWLPADAEPLELHALARRLHDADRAIRAADRTWTEVATKATSLGGDDARYLAVGRLLDEAGRLLGAEGLSTRDDAIDAVVRTLEATRGPGTGSAVGTTEIVLLGTVDPTPRDRRLLEAAAAAGCRVRPFVITADADLARFDRFGGLDLDAWSAGPPVVPLEAISIEARPLDAAIALADWVAERQEANGDAIDPDAIAVVLADESMGESIRREFQSRGSVVHLGSGRPAIAGGLARTLERLAAWESSADSTTLGGLLADPAMAAAVAATRVVADGDREWFRASSDDRPPLERTPDAWTDWAAWSAEQMPRPIGPDWLGPDDERIRPDARRRRGRLDAVARAVRSLVGGGGDGGGDAGPTDAAAVVVGRVLDALAAIDRAAGEASSWSDASLRALRKVADAVSAVPAALQPRWTNRDAIRRLIEGLRRETMPDPGDPASIETIGWLDAPFDPAVHIAIVGLHDAAVPGVAEDPWLPQSLRKALAIDEASRRLARDTWVLATLLARDPSLRVIVPRRSGTGDELTPSRLLFGDGGDALARRVRHLFRAVDPRSAPSTLRSAFARMKPADASVPRGLRRDSMSVTEFRTYLQSPYRYWIRHVLGLDIATPVGTELDARFFGIVLHDAVEHFGRRELDRLSEGRAPLKDPQAIHDELRDGLQASLATRTLGPAGPALRLQQRIIDRRLRRVAEVQSARTREGWRVHEVEWVIDRELDLPGDEPQRVRGRIDRIDRHDEHGWMLLDFKSSDSNTSPDAAHRSKGDWIDLQLPLYRWAASFAADAPGIDDIRSGYFLAGSALDKIDVRESKKIDPLHDEAIDTAREVVHSIRCGYFDLPGESPYADDPVGLLMRSTALAADGEGGS